MPILAALWSDDAPAADGPVSCGIAAYPTNDDPLGTNVRSGPSSRAPVIVVSPSDHEAIATITGFDKGWFRVEELQQVGTDHDRTLLRGVGWIHHSQLHIDIAASDRSLYAEPREGSRILRPLRGEQEGVVLLACSGEWAQVRVDDTTGWLSPGGQCSNPLTTCP